MTRVLIVGLLPVQAEKIKEAFGAMFDLRFANEKASVSSITAKAKHSDAVLAMGDFLAHTRDNAIKKHPGYHVVRGGVSNLKNFLKELAK